MMARFNNGWVKLYRSVADADLADNPLLLGLWIKLLLWAHWKPSKIVWKGQQRELPAGSVVFGVREIARKWRVSPDSISRWLKYLVDSGRIAWESSARGSVVTILNWEQYQSEDDDGRTLIGHQPDTDRTLVGHEPALIEEGKKRRKKKEELCALTRTDTSGFELKPSNDAETSPVLQTSELPATQGKKPKFDDATRNKMRRFFAVYADGYKTKYGAPPEGMRDKAIIGKVGHWIESVSEDRAVQLAQVYLQIDHKWINESCHDLWQFFRHLNRIGNALTTGQDPGGIDWNRVFGRSA
jgi:hypothetical protein